MILPIRPAITLFPPLSLREDDDGNVESLDHYMVRLADCLGISVAAVFRMLASRSSTGEIPSRDVGNRNAWIGPNPRTADCVSSLIQATGVPDLYRGTFRNLSPILSGIGFANCNSSANARRWCPRCYLEWEDDTSFEPLYWSFGALGKCPIHECKIITRCVTCGSRQMHGAKYSIRRQCRSCLRPLGSTSPRVKTEPYEDWVNRQCIQTARAAATLEHPIPPDTFDRYFTRVLARWSEGEPISRYVKASMNNLEARWRKGDRLLRPTMTQYLNFASFHGSSVEEIMLSPESAAAEPLIEGARQSFTHFSLRRPRKESLVSLKLAMEKLIASDIPLLPSASAITSAFEIDLAYARERMCDAIAAYTSVRNSQGRRYSKQELRRAFCCAVSVLRYQGEATVQLDLLARSVSARARCSEDPARSAAQAAIVVVPCFATQEPPPLSEREAKIDANRMVRS